MRLGPLLALLFTLALGLLAPGPARAGEPAARRAPARAAQHPRAAAGDDDAGPDFCERRLLRPFLEHFRIASPDPERSTVELRDEVARSLEGAGARRGDVEFLIATVADPIDSGLYYQFDRSLEAVQIAIQSQDLLPDQSWLPWADVQVTDPDEAERVKECRREVPAVVLFRGAPPSASLFVLFLVGETPTWGLHKEALSRALTFLDWAPQTVEHAVEGRIMGPTFSGSAPSLLYTIRTWYDRAAIPRMQRFHVLSGSATSPSTKAVLEAPRGSPPVPPFVDFQATVVPDDARQCAFYRYLHDELEVPLRPDAGGVSGQLEGVALLSEALTAYGDAFSAAAPGRARPGGTASPAPGCYRPAVELTFPQHISSVRRSYDGVAAPAGETGTSPPAIVRTAPPVPEEPADARDAARALSPRTTSAHDVLLSALMAGVARQEVRYVGLAATDAADAVFLAQRIRAAAPDVRLFSFDSEILYAHPGYADVLGGMLVVSPYPFFGAGTYTGGPPAARHPMFEGEGVQGAYNATLALLGGPGLGELSGYRPLVSGFPLPLWIGVVGGSGVWPIAVRSYDQSDRYVFQPDGPGASPPGDDLLVDSGLAPPRFWQMVLLILSLFSLYNVMGRAQWSTRARTARPSAVYRALSGFDDRSPCRAPVRRRLYVLVALAALFAVQAYLVLVDGASVLFVYHRTGAHPRMGASYLLLGLGAGSTVLLLGTLVKAVAAWWRAVLEELAGPPEDAGLVARLGRLGRAGLRAPGDGWRFLWTGIVPDERRWRGVDAGLRGLAALLASGAGVAWAAAVLFDTRRGGGLSLPFAAGAGNLAGAARVLFLERAVNVGNGVSPVVPLLIGGACVYAWAMSHLSRLRLIEALQLAEPEPAAAPEGSDVSIPPASRRDPADSPAQTPIGRILGQGAPDVSVLDRRLVRVLETPGLAGRTYLVTIVTMAVIPIVAFVMKRLSTLEGPLGWMTLAVMLIVCAVTAGSALVRLLYYWTRLHALLRRLARHPLASAFQRLPPSRAKSVEAQLSSRPTLRDMIVPLHQLRTLTRRLDLLGPADRATFEAILTPERLRRVTAIAQGELEQAARGALGTTLLGPPAVPAEAKDLLGELVSVAARLALALAGYWYGTDAVAPAPDAGAAGALGDVEGRAPGPRPPRAPLPLVGVGTAIAAFRAAGQEGKREGAKTSKGGEGADGDGADDDGGDGADGDGGADGGAEGDGGAPPERTGLSSGAGLAAYTGARDASTLSWLRLAEELVATVVSIFVERLLRQFRNFLTTIVAGALSLLVSVMSYAFQPRRLLLSFIWVVMSSAVGAGLWVFLQLDRDELLSRIAGTTPGRITVNRAFLFRLVGWVAVPLLGVAAAQYPDVATALFSWIEPFAKALR